MRLHKTDASGKITVGDVETSMDDDIEGDEMDGGLGGSNLGDAEVSGASQKAMLRVTRRPTMKRGRQMTCLSALGQQDELNGSIDANSAPWDVIRWAKLKKLTTQNLGNSEQNDYHPSPSPSSPPPQPTLQK
ncbi:hypothetical protein BGX38DRAFT_897579 [Terfezia claveryi]|nr:hypothetical protein BGX38DRAFT_897579 [Terfezia claveryi]